MRCVVSSSLEFLVELALLQDIRGNKSYDLWSTDLVGYELDMVYFQGRVPLASQDTEHENAQVSTLLLSEITLDLACPSTPAYPMHQEHHDLKERMF